MKKCWLTYASFVTLLYSQSIDYLPNSQMNTFMLVIDKSGSMNGDAIQNTKKGAINLISHMNASDRAGLITFSDGISLDVPITNNKKELKRGINKISVGGVTKLYDALASGVKYLINDSGSRIIIYLTDGKDTGSNFSTRNLRSMFQGENTYVYGIGIGDEVDVKTLIELSSVTGGDFHTISSLNTSDIKTIYSDVLSSFYKNHVVTRASTGNLIVRSIPSEKVVRVNNENKGITPIRLSNLTPGGLDVEVHFEYDKLWKQTIEIKVGYTASVQAREKDAMKNLWVISKPHGASVFIDGEYVGYTSNEIVNTKKRKWYKRVFNNPKELKIVGLKPGTHIIEIIGFPDFDYGSEQKVTINYLLEDDDIIFVDIFKNLIKNKKGDEILGKQRRSAFDF